MKLALAREAKLDGLLDQVQTAPPGFPVGLHQGGETRQRFVPALPFPLLRAGLADLGVRQAARAAHEVEQARALGA